MRIVVALGGNALARRGEPVDAGTARRRLAEAAKALAVLARDHAIVVTHGNGPQVGLLALRAEAMPGAGSTRAEPLDVLDAETEGMIGYLVEQELRRELPGREVATLLTQIEVSASDPAFGAPTKPIGPVYLEDEARRLAAERGFAVARDGGGWRRVVPSPSPRRIIELPAIARLVDAGVVVVCAGGGGIPVVVGADGEVRGVEAVIDKDRSAALLAEGLGADLLVLLTDVDAAFEGWGTSAARPIAAVTPSVLRALPFDAGSMRPKVQAACDFVERTGGRAAIGKLSRAAAVVAGEAGTQVTLDDKSASRRAPTVTLHPANPRLLDELEPFVVATPSTLAALDPRPFGLSISPGARFDPLRLDAEPMLTLLQRLDALTFGPEGMPMPRWVFLDAAELPGAIVGLGRRAERTTSAERALFELPRGYTGIVPLSMYIAIPLLEPGTWVGHNLASLASLLPDEPLRGLGALTKALALRVLRARAQVGVTQWRHPALALHARLGPLRLLSAWTPAHSDPATLVYRVAIDDGALRNLACDPAGAIACPAATLSVRSDDEQALRALQRRIEAGEQLAVVGAPESIAPGVQRAAIAGAR